MTNQIPNVTEDRVMETDQIAVDKPTEAVVTEHKVNALRIADRCDYCGAQAFSLVKIPTVNEAGEEIVGELMLCGHDLQKHLDRLKKVALTIEDYRPSLAETGTFSSY